MTFHSYNFILIVLPALYMGFLLAHKAHGWTGAFRFLAVGSLIFYSAWSYILLAILMASVAGNYVIGNAILKFRENPRIALALLFVGLLANGSALIYLKYVNFLIDISNQITSFDASHVVLIVPIGVSFYTFVQIGYLVEAYAGQVEKVDFWRYTLFATFLPCVTAGPLVQQREMFDQMKERHDPAFNPITLATGLTMFMMGLFKKVVFADQLQPMSDAVFNGAAEAGTISTGIAWLGSVCYALQLYFDFSGYSDMALGIGCIFGLKLPLNFDSPFKATNISDFWRRWHMTMTCFFTSYIYTPLAVRGMRRIVGSKAGSLKRYLLTAAVPAVVTFLVAGVWHGAGWTFVVYGLMHGCAVALYLGWSRLERKPLPAPLSWLLTMAVVVSALVVFRAPDLTTAAKILASMWTFRSAIVSPGDVAAILIDVRISTAMVVLLGAVVLLLPNTQQILHRYGPSSDAPAPNAAFEAGLLSWRPSLGSALAMSVVACVAIASIGVGSAFLYYQF